MGLRLVSVVGVPPRLDLRIPKSIELRKNFYEILKDSIRPGLRKTLIEDQPLTNQHDTKSRSKPPNYGYFESGRWTSEYPPFLALDLNASELFE